MQPAAFSLENYQFDKVNIDLENHKSKDLNLSFDTKGIFNKKTKKFELIFQVTVKQSGNDIPFVEIRCKGLFTFENVSKIDDVPDFFYRNSIAILFPYVRTYLSLVTTQANVPGIILPTLNLSGLESELRRNTTQK
jgi:preprotein translocase subunit SecB